VIEINPRVLRFKPKTVVTCPVFSTKYVQLNKKTLVNLDDPPLKG
jgi:hypothetical protein